MAHSLRFIVGLQAWSGTPAANIVGESFHPFDDLPPHNLRKQNVLWGQGEDDYWRATQEAESAADSILQLLNVGSILLAKYDWIASACQGGLSGLAAGTFKLCKAPCQRAIRVSAVLHLPRCARAVTRMATGLAGMRLKKPELQNVDSISAHHWQQAALRLNRSQSSIMQMLADSASCDTIISAWADMVNMIATRAELFRWHSTYSLFVHLYKKTSNGIVLPPIVFHEFCCSSAEVLVQVAQSHGLFKSHEEMQKLFVEVGVETGATSAVLLKLLPEHIKLVGVDPFAYDEASDMTKSNLAGASRLSQHWVASLRPRVEKLYSEASPGRATLIPRGSPDAVDDQVFQEPRGIDMVFIDGDHSRGAVLRDIAAWLPLLQKPAPEVPMRVMAGHDFSLQFPGVVSSVIRLAQGPNFGALSGDVKGNGSRCCAPQAGGHWGATINVGCNAVWWISVAPKNRPS